MHHKKSNLEYIPLLSEFFFKKKNRWENVLPVSLQVTSNITCSVFFLLVMHFSEGNASLVAEEMLVGEVLVPIDLYPTALFYSFNPSEVWNC